MFFATTKHGNNPFYRMLTGTRTHTTQFHSEAFVELMNVYNDQFLSPIYVGWARGFLDDERAKLTAALEDQPWANLVSIDHPVTQIRKYAAELREPKNALWYD